MPKNKNYEIIKDYFINREIKGDTCDIYKRTMKHKYRHTMKVVKTGREIIRNEPRLNSLPIDIQEDFINACLFHDVSRAFDVDPYSGKYLFKNHGIESAKVVKQCGINTLNILIPVMLHDLINGFLLYLPMYELEVDIRYLSLTDENKAFVKEMRDAFWALSEDEREIIELGRRLVKDADMLANWREFDRLAHVRYPHVLQINEKVQIEFLNSILVNIANIESFVDYMILVMAWGTSLYYSYSVKCGIDEKIPDRIKDFYIAESLKNGFTNEEIKPIVAIVEKGLSLIKIKMQENIKSHAKK